MVKIEVLQEVVEKEKFFYLVVIQLEMFYQFYEDFLKKFSNILFFLLNLESIDLVVELEKIIVLVFIEKLEYFEFCGKELKNIF